MNYNKAPANKFDQVIENIEASCSEFYRRHKRLLYSIVLTGSLARREVSKENGTYDADMLVVTRYYYNPILCKFLKTHLEKKTKRVKFDLGRSCPLSRLTREKSLFLYDIKNNGVILAGNDARKMIREHSLHDLYPFESIRLLLNASCRLVFSLGQEEVEIKRELNKAMRCCIDAYLLHHGQFAPTMKERKIMLKRDQLKIFKNIQNVIECDDLNVKYMKGRQELLSVMDLMRTRLGLENIKSLTNYLRERSDYPFPFKVYTLVTSRHVGSIFTNPIFDIYAWALGVLQKLEKPASLEPQCAHHEYFQNIWTKLPQPVTLGRAS